MSSLLALLILLLPAVIHAGTPQEAAREALSRDLESQSGWLQIYAAEGILEIGTAEDRESVYQTFLAIEKSGPHAGTEQIGIWRVLAQAAPDDQHRQQRIGQLSAIAVTPGESRRLHAVETLAKLKSVSPEVLEATAQWRVAAEPAVVPFCYWAESFGPEPHRAEAIRNLKKSLGAKAPVARSRAIYALGQLARIDTAFREDIAQALRPALAGEPAGSVIHDQLRCALYLATVQEEERSALRQSLLETLFTTSGSARNIAATLAGSIPASEQAALTDRLLPLLQSDDFHHRWAAARLLASFE